MSAHRKRPGRPRGSSAQAGFRITPVWRKDFDRAAFARAMLLLAMHLDEQNQKPHKRGNTYEQPSDGKQGGDDNEPAQ